jgi:hypothetical protein
MHSCELEGVELCVTRALGFQVFALKSLNKSRAVSMHQVEQVVPPNRNEPSTRSSSTTLESMQRV